VQSLCDFFISLKDSVRIFLYIWENNKKVHLITWFIRLYFYWFALFGNAH